MKGSSIEGEFESHTDFLDTYIEDGIAVFHLQDRVFEMAIDLSLREALFRKIEMADRSADVRALLFLNEDSVMGEEKNLEFWKGIAELRDGRRTSAMPSDLDPMTMLAREENALGEYIRKMCRCGKVTITTLRGSVVGGFLGASLAVDFRIASETAVFSFPHVRFEMPPQGALAFFLPRYVGYGKAKRILLRGEPIDVREAEALHLVDRVLPAKGFNDRCLQVAKEFAGVPTEVVRMTKSILASTLGELESCLAAEREFMQVHHLKFPPDDA